jgi:hypothetical protein
MLPDIRKKTALFEGNQVSPICPYDKSNVKTKISMENWWNDNDKRKMRYCVIKVSHRATSSTSHTLISYFLAPF